MCHVSTFLFIYFSLRFTLENCRHLHEVEWWVKVPYNYYYQILYLLSICFWTSFYLMISSPFWLVGWGLVVIFPSSLIFLPNSAPLCFFLFQAVLVVSCVQASYNFRIICVSSLDMFRYYWLPIKFQQVHTCSIHMCTYTNIVQAYKIWMYFMDMIYILNKHVLILWNLVLDAKKVWCLLLLILVWSVVIPATTLAWNMLERLAVTVIEFTYPVTWGGWLVITTKLSQFLILPDSGPIICFNLHGFQHMKTSLYTTAVENKSSRRGFTKRYLSLICSS